MKDCEKVETKEKCINAEGIIMKGLESKESEQTQSTISIESKQETDGHIPSDFKSQDPEVYDKMDGYLYQNYLNNEGNDIDEDRLKEQSDEHEKEQSDEHEKDQIIVLNGIPLSEIIRPKCLDEYIGQNHLINDYNGSIKNFIRLGYLPSMVLYGPPGVGKTSIASILAKETGYVFVEFSATDATVGDVRQISDIIRKENMKREVKGVEYLRVVIFIDEIHRFSKTQQDFLLPYIESGQFSFIGATTLNPESRIRRAIVSRCQIFKLKVLEPTEIEKVVRKAILYENIRRRKIRTLRFLSYGDECLKLIIRQCNSDTRSAVNLIELVSSHYNSDSLAYEFGNHEPFRLEPINLQNAINTLKISHSGLQNRKNLNLFLNFYDSMRQIHGNRSCEDVPISTNSKSNDHLLGNHLDHSDPLLEDLDEVSFVNPESDDHHNKIVTNVSKVIVEESKNDSLVVKITLGNLRKESQTVGVVDKLNSSEAELSDIDYSNDELMDDNTMHKEYIDRMIVSDDSDVELGPVYSDCEEDIKPMNLSHVSFSKYFVLSSIHSLLLLLKRGETPFYIGKQLVLFTAVYLDSDNSEMAKIMALLKSLKNSNSDALMVLSNCVERLCRTKKLLISESIGFIRNLKKIKHYCFSKNNGVDKYSQSSEIVEGEVIYDNNLIEDLLNPTSLECNVTNNPVFDIEYPSDIESELFMENYMQYEKSYD